MLFHEKHVLDEEKKFTMAEFRDQFMPFVALDLSFQRPFCWETFREVEFLLTLANLQTGGDNITVIDLKKSVREAQRFKKYKAIEFFEYWMDKEKNGVQDYKYLSVDGNSRTTTIGNFFENKTKISGDFFTADARKKLNNVLYEDLDEETKDWFENTSYVKVKLLTVADDEIVREWCAKKNENEPWVDMEKLNCKYGDLDLIKWARDLSQNLESKVLSLGFPLKSWCFLRYNLMQKILTILLLYRKKFSYSVKEGDIQEFIATAGSINPDALEVHMKKIEKLFLGKIIPLMEARKKALVKAAKEKKPELKIDEKVKADIARKGLTNSWLYSLVFQLAVLEEEGLDIPKKQYKNFME